MLYHFIWQLHSTIACFSKSWYTSFLLQAFPLVFPLRLRAECSPSVSNFVLRCMGCFWFSGHVLLDFFVKVLTTAFSLMFLFLIYSYRRGSYFIWCRLFFCFWCGLSLWGIYLVYREASHCITTAHFASQIIFFI